MEYKNSSQEAPKYNYIRMWIKNINNLFAQGKINEKLFSTLKKKLLLLQLDYEKLVKLTYHLKLLDENLINNDDLITLLKENKL